MTTEQELNIRAWVQTFPKNEPAYLIRMEDDTLLKMPETEHTEPEKQIQKQCCDALINGYHGHNEEKRTPGYRFDVAKNSRYGWAPFGAIYY
eukprot:14798006-Heterocapsa_arctica.AAC.1